MPNSLISTDPIVARNFFLDIPGESSLILSGVTGLDVELDVVNVAQTGKSGKQEHIKTLGGALKVPDVSVTRVAPASATEDPLWKWFIDIRDHGFKDRADKRKNISIVLYDTTLAEVGRFNFTNAWPSKIATDGLSTDSNEPVKETITIVCERIERIK